MTLEALKRSCPKSVLALLHVLFVCISHGATSLSVYRILFNFEQSLKRGHMIGVPTNLDLKQYIELFE
jgi:hypothetical protein